MVVIADSQCFKNLDLNQNHLLPPLLNILKHPQINIITKLLVIVVAVIVFLIKSSLENLAINLILTLAETLQIIMTNTLIIILHIMNVTDFATITVIENLHHERIILLANTTIVAPLLALINLTLVFLANAPIVLIFPPPDAIDHHIGLLLNLVLTVTFCVSSCFPYTLSYSIYLSLN